MSVMTHTISSLADTASVFYKGRAGVSSIADNLRMADDAWRTLLAQAVEGKSLRAISLKANCGAGYLHSILKEGKDPTIERLIAICEQVPVSIAYILYGVDVTPEDAQILEAMKRDRKTRDAVLTLLRAHKGD